MADLKISELPVLAEADLHQNDDLPVVDYSASETKRITAKALVERGVALIDNDSIDGSKIAPNSITAAEIAPDAVGASELADDAVDTAAIEDSAVTADKLASDSVTQAKIADDAVGADELAADAVVTASIQNKQVTAAKIADNTITATQIAADAIGSSELADDSVDAGAIQTNAVTTVKINADAVTQEKIADDAVGADQLASSAVVEASIVDGSVTTDKLGADAVTQAKIANDAVGADQLASNAVVTASIQNKQVTAAKIADDTITASQIAPDAIGSSELADDSVDTDAIQGTAVTTAKIANDAVTQDKIANDAVGSDQIANGAVKAAQITNGSVTDVKLAVDSVTTNKIQDGNVTGAKLGSVTDRGLDQTGDKIGITNSVTAGSLAGIDFDEQGLITAAASEIPATDLPVATSTEVGAVKPGTGLSVTGDGTLNLGGGTFGVLGTGDVGGLSFTDGLCTGFPAGTPPVFDCDAIPIAGATAVSTGAVYVPDDAAIGLDLNSSTGELVHEQSGVAAGSYASVDVDANGHITGGSSQISQDQLPNALPAEDINTSGGKFPTVPATTEQGFVNEVVTEAIADRSIGRRHFNDISISYIQEEQPTSTAQPGSDATVFRGCLWLRPSTGTLYMFTGNNWLIVAGGKLAQENLRYCGNIDASTGLVVALTDEGAAEQLEGGGAAFAVGSPLPDADNGISGAYFFVTTAGSGINVVAVSGNNFVVGDLCLAISQATGWTQVSGAFGGGGGGGDGLWSRSGAAPIALLTPDNAEDNVNLNGSNFIRLPVNSSSDAPEGGISGSFRWNDSTDVLEVYDGSAWVSLSTAATEQWETVVAADNDDWSQDIIRTDSTTSDVAIRPSRSLVFEAGTATSPGSSGANTSQLTQAVTASRTWTLPDETGTLVSTVSTVDSSTSLTIDCGTY